MTVMGIMHALGMFAAFSKFTKMFNPLEVEAKLRHQQRAKKFNGR